MKSMIQKLNLDLLNVSSNPPHALLEKPSNYSIVLNLLGINESDIGIRVNEASREVAVLAKKEARNSKRGFFWVFGVPADGALDAISTRYRGGVLELVIPKTTQNPFGSAA